MPGSNAHTHRDLPSRVAGLVTFFGGIAMLALVFSLAYHLFTQPVSGLNLSNPPQGVPPPAASIGIALSAFLEKLLLLSLLTIVGSLVAGKGIHLVFAAGHGVSADLAATKGDAGTPPAAAPAPSVPLAGTPPPH